MPEIRIELSDDLYEKLKARAEKKEWTLSDFVHTIVAEYLNEWPQGFFEKFVGIFKDDPIELPEDVPRELDAHRDAAIEEFVQFLNSEGAERRLKELTDEWSEGYFELFGSVKDDSFKRPDQFLRPSDDTEKEP